MPTKPKPLNAPAMHSQLSDYTVPEWAAIAGLALVTLGLVLSTLFN